MLPSRVSLSPIAALLFVLLLAALSLGVPSLSAQQPKASKSDKAPADAKAPVNSVMAPTKAQLVASPAWKQINDEYQKWLNSQTIYTPADIQRINANLAAQIQAVPASEMQGFIDDWQAKLKVLNGKNFQDAQQWLGEYLSVLTDGYRRQTLKDLGLTDVANMTAGQLEDAIYRIRSDQLNTQQSQAAYNQAQQQVARMVQQNNTSTQQSQQNSSGPARFGTNVPPSRPAKFNPAPPPQQHFYVNPDGRIGFILPY